MSFLLSIFNPHDLTPTLSHAHSTHTYIHGHTHTPTYTRKLPSMYAFVYAMLFGFNTPLHSLLRKGKLQWQRVSACEPCAQVNRIYTLYSSAWLAHTQTRLAPTYPLSLPTFAWRSVQIICGFVKFALFLFILYKITQFATAEKHFSMLNARLGSQKEEEEGREGRGL